MSDKVKIAVDAMGGENSPNKIIQGIELSLKKTKPNASAPVSVASRAFFRFVIPQILTFVFNL